MTNFNLSNETLTAIKKLTKLSRAFFPDMTNVKLYISSTQVMTEYLIVPVDTGLEDNFLLDFDQDSLYTKGGKVRATPKLILNGLLPSSLKFASYSSYLERPSFYVNKEGVIVPPSLTFDIETKRKGLGLNSRIAELDPTFKRI